MHISSIDSPEKKVLCQSRRLFGIALSTIQGHRKLYFLTYQLMLQGVYYLLAEQGFTKRIDQYSLQRRLPENGVNVRYKAKHRLTGEKFVVKVAPRLPIDDPTR